MTKQNLYLGEIVKRDEIKYGSKNLIISPTGSGKTHFIMNTLTPSYEGKKLMLVSTTSLKDSFENLVGTFTTQDLRRSKMNVTDEDIYVMTYAEFGKKIVWVDDFINDYSVIFCDEIHSLFDYYFTSDSSSLTAAIKTLFYAENKTKMFYFTATTDKMDKFINKVQCDLYKKVKVINYANNEDIKRNYSKIVREFTSTDGIEEIIISLKDVKAAGERGVIFNEKIDGMSKIEDLLSKRGFNSISIWSINNAKHPMDEEQLRVRGILLNTGVIPPEYDFIIINGAMREGWNLLDKSVEVVILNTLDETNKVQARGRVRKDIYLLAERVAGDKAPIDVRIMEKEKALKVIEGVLGQELNAEDKETLAETLNIRRDSNNKIVKWRTISSVLANNGYVIKEIKRNIDGKQNRFTIVTKREDKKVSSVSRANKFVASLDELGFTSQNEKHLNSYMKLGKGTAFKHIMGSYKKYVLEENWSERKFADTTYLIAKDGGLFSAKTYANYVESNKFTEIEILSERAKYEKAALGLLMEAQAVQEQDADTKEQELLAYINSMTV